MKKGFIFLSGVAFILTFVFTSCKKKDYTCVCTETCNGVDHSTTTLTVNATKGKSATACDDMSYTTIYKSDSTTTYKRDSTVIVSCIIQ